ncbi:hypothetical protein ACI6PS_14570, partial [Flavobacterium sp. PLA-1-15]|uniref:hypothetical protein n=1 Tax=Flavobacterium sp. PLA-1-15 TaxID=3380533 RepID=UPI003B8020F7
FQCFPKNVALIAGAKVHKISTNASFLNTFFQSFFQITGNVGFGYRSFLHVLEPGWSYRGGIGGNTVPGGLDCSQMEGF